MQYIDEPITLACVYLHARSCTLPAPDSFDTKEQVLAWAYKVAWALDAVEYLHGARVDVLEPIRQSTPLAQLGIESKVSRPWTRHEAGKLMHISGHNTSATRHRDVQTLWQVNVRRGFQI